MKKTPEREKKRNITRNSEWFSLDNQETWVFCNICEYIVKQKPEIKSFVSNMNDAIKSNRKFKEKVNETLKTPPKYVKTRWSSFLLCCTYYAKHFEEITGFYLDHEFESSARNEIILSLLQQKNQLHDEIMNITMDYMDLIDLSVESENRDFKIKDAIKSILS